MKQVMMIKFDSPKWRMIDEYKVDFENAKLPIPKEYDKYLKYLYGDYMEMIPVSERHVSHDIKQIDLGEYAGYVCKDSFAKLEK